MRCYVYKIYCDGLCVCVCVCISMYYINAHHGKHFPSYYVVVVYVIFFIIFIYAGDARENKSEERLPR